MDTQTHTHTGPILRPRLLTREVINNQPSKVNIRHKPDLQHHVVHLSSSQQYAVQEEKRCIAGPNTNTLTDRQDQVSRSTLLMNPFNEMLLLT